MIIFFNSTLCFVPLLWCSIFFSSDYKWFYISYFSLIALVYSNNPLSAWVCALLRSGVPWASPPSSSWLLHQCSPNECALLIGAMSRASVMGFKHSISGHTHWKNRGGKKERGVACVEILPVLSHVISWPLCFSLIGSEACHQSGASSDSGQQETHQLLSVR